MAKKLADTNQETTNRIKALIKQLGFSPKEKEVGIFFKKYLIGCVIEIDFNNEIINYGKDIKSDSKTTQNFAQVENLVVLECVDRLLNKGYKPKDIILEKVFPSGHGHSGRLDIFVKNGEKAFLMIECKTWGAEYDKESVKIQKNGGQLFTYFQNDTKTDFLMLYTSHLIEKEIEYKCEIIKIEDSYRSAGNVEDVYNRWNKITNKNGIFEEWVEPYKFQNKLLTTRDLIPLTEEDSGKLFNGFASILRKHTVSDKPNAFNKIFNLFLAKLYDEKKPENKELHFQWMEGKDDPVEFEIRLINLHTEGMNEFLRKELQGIHNEDFEGYDNDLEELYKKKKNRLKIDKILDIKEVFDDESFEDNFDVLKEVIQMLEKYQIRYPRRQQYLSDFFERLLTTGLKQEAGQYFTPVPITHFIVRSLPIKEMIEKSVNSTSETLPAVIDYAAGSGHFITDILETYQDIIDNLEVTNYPPAAIKKVKAWQTDQYLWAAQYIYGIEKDYRLVKVAKVGCYFYGDGLAQVFHADGLDNFAHSSNYDGLLKKNAKAPQFDIVVSNPPYSVDAFRGNLRTKTPNDDFTLYKYLTDRSSEIECLFVERTVQLLKEGGVAGIILPSSILSNTGIYTKTRELILINFDIISITELGSNTFMATNTKTVVLFLRRKNTEKIKKTAETIFDSLEDHTVNGIENAFSLYIDHVWSSLSMSDYKSFIQKQPNEKVKKHPLYKEYRPNENIYTIEYITNGDTSHQAIEYAKKELERREAVFWTRVINLEKEKFLFFVITYPQKITIVKTGTKKAEKKFLGYQFSNRRGNEGIHSIKHGKTIDECTMLYDESNFNNPEKASTYIYKAFLFDKDFTIHESLKNNIYRVRLSDMLTFDRSNFEKNISTTIIKKSKEKNKFPLVSISEITNLIESGSRPEGGVSNNTEGVYSLGGEHIDNINGCLNLSSPKFVPISFYDNTTKGKLQKNDLLICKDGALTGKVALVRDELINIKAMINEHVYIIRCQNLVTQKYLFYYLFSEKGQALLKNNITGAAQGGLNSTNLQKIRIPLPPKEIQNKIAAEIEELEKQEITAKKGIEKGKEKIENICSRMYQSNYNMVKLINLVITNPSKSEISGLDEKTLISFIDMSSVSNDGYISQKLDIRFSEIKKGSYTYFREGDIIIAKITPCMENGKCALATNLTNGLALGSSEFHVFRANNEKINTKYLFTLLNRKTIRIEAEKNMTGASGHRRVPITFYENLQIPLPSLSEQQKVVSEIEKIEAKIQNLQKELEQFPKQKEAVLKKYL